MTHPNASWTNQTEPGGSLGHLKRRCLPPPYQVSFWKECATILSLSIFILFWRAKVRQHFHLIFWNIFWKDCRTACQRNISTMGNTSFAHKCNKWFNFFLICRVRGFENVVIVSVRVQNSFYRKLWRPGKRLIWSSCCFIETFLNKIEGLTRLT